MEPITRPWTGHRQTLTPRGNLMSPICHGRRPENPKEMGRTGNALESNLEPYCCESNDSESDEIGSAFLSNDKRVLFK